jgi:hypothetical protein
MPEFRKTWLIKFQRNVSNDVYINGCNDSSSIASALASHFSKFRICKASSNKDDIKLLLRGCSGKELSAFDTVKLINVEAVDNSTLFQTGQS